MRTLVWFRGKDLRVADHLPLHAALRGDELIPLFVLDPYFFAPERAGPIAHRIQFLLESLDELRAGIEALGSRLVVAEGKSVEVVPRVARQWRVDRVVAQRWCAPFARERDRRVQAALEVPLELCEGETLHRLGTLRTGDGNPFSIFTPFSQAFLRQVEVTKPLPPPRELPPLPRDVDPPTARTPTLVELGISRNPRLLGGGESRAQRRLNDFLTGPGRDYGAGRDRLDRPGTSRLSQDLKFGTLSPRTVWHAAHDALGASPEALRSFMNELLWREFAHSIMGDRPELLTEPFRPKWKGFPWRFDERLWQSWIEGKTGYPVVDAAARQLLGEGFVHNRARMIAASFLTKHLLIDYRRGEAHYLQTLTDGDWANNNAGWQWSAGCGSDAQPYFRIFNPVTQGNRFDPSGDYVRTWVPELAKLPPKFIHAPWLAPASVLSAAGVDLGHTYPAPVVDHAEARRRFLAVARAHLGSEN
jgi:deoxyribodipyrimidine photo-lyase